MNQRNAGPLKWCCAEKTASNHREAKLPSPGWCSLSQWHFQANKGREKCLGNKLGLALRCEIKILNVTERAFIWCILSESKAALCSSSSVTEFAFVFAGGGDARSGDRHRRPSGGQQRRREGQQTAGRTPMTVCVCVCVLAFVLPHI